MTSAVRFTVCVQRPWRRPVPVNGSYSGYRWRASSSLTFASPQCKIRPGQGAGDILAGAAVIVFFQFRLPCHPTGLNPKPGSAVYTEPSGIFSPIVLMVWPAASYSCSTSTSRPLAALHRQAIFLHIRRRTRPDTAAASVPVRRVKYSQTGHPPGGKAVQGGVFRAGVKVHHCHALKIRPVSHVRHLLLIASGVVGRLNVGIKYRAQPARRQLSAVQFAGVLVHNRFLPSQPFDSSSGSSCAANSGTSRRQPVPPSGHHGYPSAHPVSAHPPP